MLHCIQHIDISLFLFTKFFDHNHDFPVGCWYIRLWYRRLLGLVSVLRYILHVYIKKFYHLLYSIMKHTRQWLHLDWNRSIAWVSKSPCCRPIHTQSTHTNICRDIQPKKPSAPLAYWATASADGHIKSNAPDLFRPPKVSGSEPG